MPFGPKARQGLLHVASWILYAGALFAVAATGMAAVAYVRVAAAASLPIVVPAAVIVAGGAALAILCAAAGTALQVVLGVAGRLDARAPVRPRPVQPWPPATLIDLTRPTEAPRPTVPSR